ncbi:hypothetical protein [Lamprocystis purpurea]|uniref:hypothetical protein n=1 Tax=Lamprocystis purpurea TaxID=61598 RepID=UPI00037094CF|nr:hypothetical protein [Lamprocystis purpurea]
MDAAGPPPPPDPTATLGQWNYWLAQGRDAAETARRLALVPACYREQVAAHLRVVVRHRGD